jgi:diacylglycerol kinase
MIGHRVLSFKYAFAGIFRALKEEPNLKFHFLAALVVIIAGIILSLSRIEWVVVILLIGLVISLELTNTAIEEVVNSFTIEEHPAAKRAKDISAGAVLVVAISASVIGLIIFLPHLY